VPRRTLVSDRILEENGVLGEVTIGECPLFLIPLEPDLLSLELEDAFSDLYLVCVTLSHHYKNTDPNHSAKTLHPSSSLPRR
jgi:hypothetical protein